MTEEIVKKTTKMIQSLIIGALASSTVFAGGVTAGYLQTRVLETSSEYTDFAVKSEVSNQSDNESVRVTFQAVDPDGFEIGTVTLRGKIPPGQVRTLTEKSIMKNKEYARINRWQLKN